MKTLQTFRLLFATAATASLFAACRPDDDLVPDPGGGGGTVQASLIKKLTVEENGDSTIYDLFYDGDNRVDSVRVSTSQTGYYYTKVFSHTSGLITSTTPMLGSMGLTDSIWLDEASRPVRMASWYFGTQFGGARYEYDGDGHLIHTIALDPNGQDMNTVNHFWSGGNMAGTHDEISGDTALFGYDLNKPFTRGESRHVDALLQTGRNYVASENLQVSTTQEGVTSEYLYEYDEDGRIIRAWSSDNEADHYLIEY